MCAARSISRRASADKDKCWAAAPRFSKKRGRLVVPEIGAIQDFGAGSQARAIRAGVACLCCARRPSMPFGLSGYRSNLASLIHFAMAGSRWSKKTLALVSSVAMAARSSARSSKSKMAKFSAMRSGRTYLGMATTPRCVSQRSTTCATLRWYVAARFCSSSLVKRWLRPSANGPHDSSCTPFSCKNCWVSTCW